MNSQGLKNLCLLSAAARYNTERRPLLRGYFDNALQSGQIFGKGVTDSSISNYWDDEYMSPDHPQKSFRQLLQIYPDDPNIQHYQLYLNIRYSHMSEPIRDVLGYSAVDLISLEAFIYNQITKRAENLGINSTSHTFRGKEELIQTGEYERPSEVFQNKWLSCIEFSRNELINKFLTKTENQPPSQHFSISERIDSVHSMLKFLSTLFAEDVEYSQNQFFSTPLFEIEGKEDRILVPFPALLVSTAQFRIEELFQQHKALRTKEDREKGKLIEELTMDALSEFDNRNLIHSLKYTDPHPRETDGLLLFENSFWSVEVKSHPIFRKLPNDIRTAMNRFEKKTKEAITQGENTRNFLSGQGSDLLYNLAGEKSPDEIASGTIVVLDGLLPTLFSQNKRIDQMFGMDGIYEVIEKDDRVLIITLFDLFELANQVDELDRLEEYLLWRTDFGFDMPVFAFNERDYWAMFFDNYLIDDEFKETIDDAAKTDSLVAYISDRFNHKSHLPDDGF